MYVKNVCHLSKDSWDPTFFPFLVEGGAEGICTCTEEHKIKYEYHVEQKQIPPFTQGKVVICMMNNNHWHIK
jgi:hypothetical protein